MLNNPPDITTGQLPSAVTQTPAPNPYQFEDTDYLGSKNHRWLEPYDIGLISLNGSNAVQVVAGLAQGQSMTINSDQKPDRWVVAISNEVAVVAARISLSPASGGPGFRIGAGQKLKLPATGNYLTITNVSTTAVTLFGVVVAVGGWDFGDIDVG